MGDITSSVLEVKRGQESFPRAILPFLVTSDRVQCDKEPASAVPLSTREAPDGRGGRGDGGVPQAPPPPQTEVSSFSPLGGATEPPPSPGAERDPPTPPARSRSRALPLGGGPAPRRRGLSHDERETARDSQSPGSSVDGGEGSRPDSSPNFSRPPRRERRRKQSRGGEVESEIQGGPGQAGSRPRCDLAEEQWIFRREGASPCPPSPNRRDLPASGTCRGSRPPLSRLSLPGAPRPDLRAAPRRAPDSPDAGGWTDRRAGARGEAAGLF
ncbi:unnamed protein product [Rangifer tarandus platyrhynchus]|uniref:Uncharacterized protein n=1 Tax=Rangifer tarandus platyrhynchus TaxID=3082113 RepID=A0AC59ZR49_RANTA